MKIWINFLMVLSLACMLAGLMQLWAIAAFGAGTYLCTWILIFINHERSNDFSSVVSFDRSKKES